MRRMGPDGVALDELARSVKAVAASEEGDSAPAEGAADWAAPPKLARDGLVALTRALSQAGSVWTLDWRALGAIGSDAAAPLRVLFAHWADSPVKLRFIGAAQLLAVLAESAPNNERGIDDVWWQLHMAALRLMHLPDDFELVALNYCITYEVSPPSFEAPLYVSTAAPAPGHGDRFMLPALVSGPETSLLAAIDAYAQERETLVLDCSRLARIDYAGAGSLLARLDAHGAAGRAVELRELNHLVATLLRLLGAGDGVRLYPHRY